MDVSLLDTLSQVGQRSQGLARRRREEKQETRMHCLALHPLISSVDSGVQVSLLFVPGLLKASALGLPRLPLTCSWCDANSGLADARSQLM